MKKLGTKTPIMEFNQARTVLGSRGGGSSGSHTDTPLQQHDIAGGVHTALVGDAGWFIRSTGLNTFAWSEITASDLPAISTGSGAIYFHVEGALATVTQVVTFVAPHDGVISKVYIYAETVGTAGNTIVDVNKNAVTIFTTQANRPTLAWNDADHLAVSGTPDVTAFIEGDLISVDIDSVATGAVTLDGCIVLAISGGTGAPNDSQFVTLATDADLTNERVLTQVTGETVVTDNGAGLTVTVGLANTAVTPDTYGDATHVSVVTIDQKGRITGASETAIHDAVTLDAATHADDVLGLTGQAITLDNQAANSVFAGPATVPAAAPTFRALVAADIPVGGGDEPTWKVGFFGDGSDGNVTIAADTALTRPMYYNTLTVQNGATLRTEGLPIFAKTKVTVDSGGEICVCDPAYDAIDGGAGGNGTAVAGGAAGTPGTNTVFPSVYPESNSGDGGAPSGAGTSGDSGITPFSTYFTGTLADGQIGAAGGNGGIGAGGTGGAGSTQVGFEGYLYLYGTACYKMLANIPTVTIFETPSVAFITLFVNYPNGGSGGGGGGVADGGGGGGGQGASMYYPLAICAYEIENNGTLSNRGGNGGNGGSGFAANSGGGGGGNGGNGGIIWLGYKTKSGSGSTSVTGGTAGTGGAGGTSTGANGTNGLSGTVIEVHP